MLEQNIFQTLFEGPSALQYFRHAFNIFLKSMSEYLIEVASGACANAEYATSDLTNICIKMDFPGLRVIYIYFWQSGGKYCTGSITKVMSQNVLQAEVME